MSRQRDTLRARFSLSTWVLIVLFVADARAQTVTVGVGADLTSQPGLTVTVPLEIGEADGVDAVDLELAFDTEILAVSDVRPGVVIADAGESPNQFLFRVDEDDGRILLGTFFLLTRTVEGGTFVEIDFLVSPDAEEGMTELDLVEFSINEGALEVDPEPVSGDDPTDGELSIVIPRPDISVTPGSLDFGVVEVGQSASLFVTIGNEGEAPLAIFGVETTDTTSSEFVVVPVADGAEVPVGGELAVEIRYEPSDDGEDVGTLVISSDDPDEPDVEVDLSGEGEDPEPVFYRGDSDGNGGFDLTDGVFIFNFLFSGGPTPECMDAADSNDSGLLDLSDGVFILNFLFVGGPPPPDPGPPGETPCGPDPAAEPDTLGCDFYDGCV